MAHINIFRLVQLIELFWVEVFRLAYCRDANFCWWIPVFKPKRCHSISNWTLKLLVIFDNLKTNLILCKINFLSFFLEILIFCKIYLCTQILVHIARYHENHTKNKQTDTYNRRPRIVAVKVRRVIWCTKGLRQGLDRCLHSFENQLLPMNVQFVL